jgi:hypothetical protein
MPTLVVNAQLRSCAVALVALGLLAFAGIAASVDDKVALRLAQPCHDDFTNHASP